MVPIAAERVVSPPPDIFFYDKKGGAESDEDCKSRDSDDKKKLKLFKITFETAAQIEASAAAQNEGKRCHLTTPVGGTRERPSAP